MATTRAKKCLKIVLLVIISLLLIAIVVASIYFFSIYFSVSFDPTSIEDTTVKLTILDRDGKDLDIANILNNDVTIEEVSPYIIDAFIATEDKRFYEHNGVDYVRIAGATISNLKSGYLKEGGSTITQQLIKNTQIGDEKTFSRKIKELRLAKQMEKHSSKSRILEMYLNNIYFGNGLYGIRSASMRIFGKQPLDVSIEEAAVLAGIVKNPLKNSPLNSIDNALARRNIVLDLMYKNGKIDQKTCQIAQANPIVVSDHKIETPDILPYIDEALLEASDILDISQNDLLKSDITISTYLDAQLQATVSNTASTSIISCLDNTDANRYIIASDNKNGGITAFYSDFSMSIYDMRRQVGSTIKPFLAYIPAIEYAGFAPISPVLDTKESFSGYVPSNSGNVYRGIISLTDAVAYSSNVVPVSIARDLGLDKCKYLAQNCGITFDKEDNSLPIVLGGMQYGLTGLELLGAYMTIANGGQYVAPAFISNISQHAKVLYERNTQKSRAFSAETAYLMTEALFYAADYGTAKALTNIDNIAAKTGTVGGANGNSDALCAVYSPDFTLVTHCLNYTSSSTSNMPSDVTGGSIAAKLALPIVESMPQHQAFIKPRGITTLDIDLLTLKRDGDIKLASPNTPVEYQTKAIFNNRYAPTTVTTEYDVLPLQSFEVNTMDGGITIEFIANAAYTYQVIYEGQIIEELHNFEGLYRHVDHIFDNGYYEYEVISKNKYGIKTSNKKGVYVTPFLEDNIFDYFLAPG